MLKLRGSYNNDDKDMAVHLKFQVREKVIWSFSEPTFLVARI
jgi:hypothetical protein